MSQADTLADLASAASFAFSWRNRIVNGAMQIDQRNAGNAQNFANTVAYSLDRWAAVSSAAPSGTITVQQQSDGSGGYCVRLARSAGTYAGGLSIGQCIESANCVDLAGQSVTIQFKARKGSSYNAGLQCLVRTGTATDESSTAMITGTYTGAATPISSDVGASLTTSWQTFTATATFASNARECGVQFYTGLFTGTGGANDYVEIKDVQIEGGLIATPFVRRPFAVEFALCQRYYFKTFPLTTKPAQNAGITNAYSFGQLVSGAASCFYPKMPFPVQMRANPTMVGFNPSAANGQARNNATGTDYSSSTVGGDTWGWQFTGTGPAGGTAGQGSYIHCTADAEL